MFKRLLIANRGEIAIRIARTAAEMGIATLAVFSEDDAASLHVRKADDARGLKGSGPAAYLDAAQIVGIAKAEDCDAIHPGYGFLSENADFARRLPTRRGSFSWDRPRTRSHCSATRPPPAPRRPGSAFPPCRARRAASHAKKRRPSSTRMAPIMLKAVAGGGGRGMRPVRNAQDLDQAYERCQSEALQALRQWRSLCRRNISRTPAMSKCRSSATAPGRCPSLGPRMQPAAPAPEDRGDRACLAPCRMRSAQAARRRHKLGVAAPVIAPWAPSSSSSSATGPAFAFIEANPRLQVEHTVTEEVTGLDLVRLQLESHAGAHAWTTSASTQKDVPAPRGAAMQARVNLETMGDDGGGAALRRHARRL